MRRYRCVDDQKAAGFPVTQACAVLGVSTSAYYDWHATGRQAAGERQRRDATPSWPLRSVRSNREHPDYGSPRVTVELARRGRPVNHKKAETLMAAAGVVARRHRRRRSLTKRDDAAPPLPDLGGRLFDPDRLDHTWAGDVSYVPTDEGWLYLATVDLGSRRLLGYAMSEAADTDRVIDALAMAVAARGRTTMGGDTILLATLKQELGRRHFATRADARRAIFVSGSTTTTGRACTPPAATGRPSSTNNS